MLYDLRVRPEQLQKLAEWAKTGESMADVELIADDSMLLAEQGDDRMAWDTDGSPGSEEYLERAPLDPSRGKPSLSPQQTVLAVRQLLNELLETGHQYADGLHTLELVCDRWDEYEQEIGTDQIGQPVQRPAERPAQWQRWTITIPAGHHKATGTNVIATCDMAFDAYILNLYPEEGMMRLVVERAGCEAVMEYAQTPTSDGRVVSDGDQ